MQNIKKIKSTNIIGLYEIELKSFADQRGNFKVLFNHSEFKSKKINSKTMSQLNLAFSKKKHTIRGMHYQVYPYSQSKLIHVLSGKVFDCVIDIRKNSKTYNNVYTKVLNQNSNLMLFVPRGLAHGYLTLTENVKFLYITDNKYNKKSERSLSWKDSRLINKWPLKNTKKIIISKKDNF